MTLTLSKSGTSKRTAGWSINARNEATQNVPTRMPVFKGMLRAGIECPGSEIANVRADIADWLNRARDPIPYVKELLRFCIARRSEGGLGFAADILSLTGELALQYALQFQGRDASRWSKEATIGSHPNDDVWRVLLVASCRASQDHDERMNLLLSCLKAGNRGIREAVVEGLGIEGSKVASLILARIAGHDPDPLIRQVAGQIRDDIS